MRHYHESKRAGHGAAAAAAARAAVRVGHEDDCGFEGGGGHSSD